MIYWLMQQKSDKIILKTIDIIFWKKIIYFSIRITMLYIHIIEINRYLFT